MRKKYFAKKKLGAFEWNEYMLIALIFSSSLSLLRAFKNGRSVGALREARPFVVVRDTVSLVISRRVTSTLRARALFIADSRFFSTSPAKYFDARPSGRGNPRRTEIRKRPRGGSHPRRVSDLRSPERGTSRSRLQVVQELSSCAVRLSPAVPRSPEESAPRGGVDGDVARR